MKFRAVRLTYCKTLYTCRKEYLAEADLEAVLAVRKLSEMCSHHANLHVYIWQFAVEQRACKSRLHITRKCTADFFYVYTVRQTDKLMRSTNRHANVYGYKARDGYKTKEAVNHWHRQSAKLQ